MLFERCNLHSSIIRNAIFPRVISNASYPLLKSAARYFADVWGFLKVAGDKIVEADHPLDEYRERGRGRDWRKIIIRRREKLIIT